MDSTSTTDAPPTVSSVDVNAISLPSGVDFTTLTTAQRSDGELKRLLTSSTSALKLQWLAEPTGSVCCDMSTGKARPFVPSNLRRSIFDLLHSLAHPGIRATQRLCTASLQVVGLSLLIEKATNVASLICNQASTSQRQIRIYSRMNVPPVVAAVDSGWLGLDLEGDEWEDLEVEEIDPALANVELGEQVVD
ncbi:hypothetical protein MRX96_047792 [Rhipicephalus microplus]